MTSPLDIDTLRSLAPAEGHALIDRYLPAPYLRAFADPKTPMVGLNRASRRTLKRIKTELSALQRSRALEFYDDLADARMLGALHDQAPWPEEDKEAFRQRLTGLVAVAMTGAASAKRMLALAGLASNARLVATRSHWTGDESYSVTHTGITQSGTLLPGQSRGFLVKPAGGKIVNADVFDAPPRLYSHEAQPLAGPHFVFDVQNPAFATLTDILSHDPRTYPDPVIDLKADADFGPLLMVRTAPDHPGTAPRVIAVNRVLPSGQTLRIDTAAMALTTDAPGAGLAWLTCRGAKGFVYAGLSEITAADSFFDNELPATPSAGYALTLRGPAGVDWTGLLDDTMIDKGPIPDGPASKIQMPSLLGLGRSRWHVVEVIRPPGAPAGDVDLHDARFRPVPADAKLKVTLNWAGRRAGEFAVEIDPKLLDLAEEGPQPHRAAWLDRMIARFKLAGTVRVSRMDDGALDGLENTAVTIALRSRVEPTDGIDIDTGPEFISGVDLGDGVEVTPQVQIDLASATGVDDDITAEGAGGFEPFVSAVEATDTMDLAAQVQLDFAEAAALEDSADIAAAAAVVDLESATKVGDGVGVHPQASLGFASPAKTGDGVEIGATDGVQNFADAVKVSDSFDLTPEARIELRSHAKAADRVGIERIGAPPTDPDRPTGPVIVTDPLRPTGPIISTDPLRPTEPVIRRSPHTISLNSRARLRDRISIRRL